MPAAERETLFADVVKEKDRAEREARKAERKRRMAAFRDLLEATPAIKVRADSLFVMTGGHTTNEAHGCTS